MCRCSECAALRRERDLLRAAYESSLNFKTWYRMDALFLYDKKLAAITALEAEYPAYREMRGDK